MRQQLIRSTVLAVGLAIVITMAPVGFAIWNASVGDGRGVVGRWLAEGTPGQTSMRLVAVVVALAVLALAAGVFVAIRQAHQMSQPMRALADRAERLGAGESRIQPLHSGIAELDQVSEVLSRSAQRLTKSLASERDFAADASHQLRTPLTALLMRLEEISVTDDLDVVQEEATIAIAQVERLTRVVDDLMARTRRGGDEPKATVSLDSVIAALQREWQPAFEQARRSVHVHGERGLVVQAKPVDLSQVLSTLLENALAHGRGTVDVHARRSGPSVVVEVSDQGEGVPSTIAPHIFERSVTTTGTGLGLALARDLAESNGGRLELIQAQPAIFALFLSESDAA
ncbi:HAMP domain-containing sensor histidine kinase [Phycicoccus sp. M110.8]|jgi:signal transduction histidine kinase|uniref:sensor histidine kinase n=1 Tax=Phycicoccus sp. M110.8 TaxID=3075433 RepID=UPI0028FD35B5|nr:HAMP domain-containing sensor histidine kinase [Phycicoccus sp. M110.8]MDU0312726.1 HAMP domain-containing sensor histidine kinase [Phycicoccus sp. M110.8]HET8767813.1 HAMP domain-containing sensor histidine kinase [Pedococcus sp.]